MTDATTERELKLTPSDPGLLDRLWSQTDLGPLRATDRHIEQQHNGFFDTRTGALRAAQIAFRRRQIGERPLATWTIKAEGEQLRGLATRTEIEVQMAGDMAPALVIHALREAAQQRNARALAEALADALTGGGLPLAQPYLETTTFRRVVDLVADDVGWQAELALDDVRLDGHAGYRQFEIEVELKRGDDAALSAARTAIEALGEVNDSATSKLAAALAHVAACDCA